MNARRTIMLGSAIILMALSFSPPAKADVVLVKYGWAEAPEGALPLEYLVEIRFKRTTDTNWGLWGQMAETEDLWVTLPFETDHCYQVRVRAKDAEGLIGPYSDPSEEFCQPAVGDNGGVQGDVPPLPPGKPKAGG